MIDDDLYNFAQATEANQLLPWMIVVVVVTLVLGMIFVI